MMGLSNGENRKKLIPPLVRIIFKIVNQIRKLPYIKTIFFFQTLESIECLSISRALSNTIYGKSISRYNFANVPERNLILNNQTINLKKNKDSYELYTSLSKEVQEHFSMSHKNHDFQTSFVIASQHNKKLISTTDPTKLEGELYRFVVDPFIVFPKICEFLTSSIFRETFQNKNPDIRIAGIHLRKSSPTIEEAHTTSFHRDYNSYYTTKIFIPLSKLMSPFLEYIPSTELLTTAIPHYTPHHVKYREMPKRVRNLPRRYSSTNIQSIQLIPTNCIHRELPSLESKITLIVTYLSHPDFGFNHPIMRQRDINKIKADPWKSNHISFIHPVC